MKIRTLFFIISIISISYLNGQVVASDDVILCDGQQGTVPVTLTATSYAVDLTDANIYTDDIFGGVIDMGFDFEFYGNTYNQVVLSSNNYLSFITSNAGAYSAWAINAAIPNNFDAPLNAILCPWQDIYPGVNGNGIIQFATTGEAPNRVFIASFCGIPMFSCTEICYSSQIKLFETTNIIETHIAQKVLCTSWNGGVAIHGLHNEDGTIAHVVTGLDGVERNYPNEWTCENDGWSFTPNGDNDYIIENIEFAPAVAGTDIIWQDEFGNQIGTGGEITVYPGGDVTYTAGASLCGDAGDWCGFEGGIEGDDVSITFEVLPINGDNTDIICYNSSDGTIEVIAPESGDWLYSLFDINNNLIDSETTSDETWIFENLEPGTYYVNITEQNSFCISEQLEFILYEPSQVNSSYINTNVECNGENDGLIEIEINGGTPPYNTILGDQENGETIDEQGGNTIIFSNLVAGNYYYTPTDVNGCLTESNEIFFTITEPSELDLSEDEIGGVTCLDAANGFIQITMSGGTPPYSYEWSNNSGFFAQTEDIANLNGGTYDLSVLDDNNCNYLTSLEITENEGIIIDPLLSECISNNGEITISTTGGTPPYIYELFNLSNNNSEAINNNGYFNNLIEGDYLIEITDELGCLEEVSINLNAAPIADFNIDFDEFYLSNNPTVFTDFSNDINIDTWTWNFGDGNTLTQYENQETSHLYTNPGTYYVTLTVVDSYGCQDELTKKIEVLQDYYSYSPNIFTPNNDGINDTFTPSLFNINEESYSLMIFDRWGKKIFETYNYNQGWDGKLENGSLLNSDTYSYKINYTTTMGIEKEEKGKLIMAK
ncbi:MAG: hypothetical protein CMD26_02340 [Flavobacteriales bacterium]|nr:hypothetical protein [Flavobacteriales bacterium]